jgi:hypothetical protein
MARLSSARLPIAPGSHASRTPRRRAVGGRSHPMPAACSTARAGQGRTALRVVEHPRGHRARPAGAGRARRRARPPSPTAAGRPPTVRRDDGGAAGRRPRPRRARRTRCARARRRGRGLEPLRVSSVRSTGGTKRTGRRSRALGETRPGCPARRGRCRRPRRGPPTTRRSRSSSGRCSTISAAARTSTSGALSGWIRPTKRSRTTASAGIPRWLPRRSPGRRAVKVARSTPGGTTAILPGRRRRARRAGGPRSSVLATSRSAISTTCSSPISRPGGSGASPSARCAFLTFAIVCIVCTRAARPTAPRRASRPARRASSASGRRRSSPRGAARARA